MTTIRRYASRRPAHLLLAFVAAIILVAGRGSGHLGLLQAQVNPILAENLLPGATDWDIVGSGHPSIQGFASDMSVNVGGTINFKIDTPSTNYRVDIYRLGYYGGLGARKVASVEPSASLPQVQGSCATEGASGLVDCGAWQVSASWAVPVGAVSGIYIARPTREDGAFIDAASHIVFVVRNDSQQADILFQTSDTTWQAYNSYGGNSLYCGGPISNAGSAYGCSGRAAKASYNRPFNTAVTSNASWVFSAEYPMVRWLEANGYNVKYWTGVDTDRFALTGANRPKAFLSVGHDEYWSGTQRTNVESARNAGVNLAFLSGNEVFWKTRWESSIDGAGTAHRTLVSYKDTLSLTGKLDPLPGVTTGTWRDTRFGPPNDGGRPENALIGSLWTVVSGTFSIKVPASMAGLRLWRDTRVADLDPGDAPAALGVGTLGYEWGEAVENGSQPAGLARMSSTTEFVEKIIDFGSQVGMGSATHSLTLYRHNSGALVFGASTVQWSWGLDANHDGGSPATHPPDQAMQQATVNLLADMGAQPSSLQVGADPSRPLVTTAASSDIFAPTSTITFPTAGGTVESGNNATISGTATEAGGGAIAGVEVSVDGGTTWRKAEGTSPWSIAWTPGNAGTTANIRTRAVDDSGNLESAGAGIFVSVVLGECPCTSLWKPSAIPANISAADSSEYELGVRFQSDINGFITGIRFYKGPANTGTHVGNLWSPAGTLMASAMFTNETAIGWQQVNFGTPVAITANTTYTASYHTPNGGYSFDPNYFATGRDAPPLHAPSTGSPNGPNGVYSPGGVAFPTNSFNANNYWVDFVFAQSLDDVTPPVISAIKATAIDSARATVSWSTNEQTSTRLDYGTNPAILTATLQNLPPGTLTVTQASFVTQHALALSGLQANTTYYYLVTAIDHSGNTTTQAAPSFTVPGPTLRDTASTDFGAGTTTSTYVSQTADGEVILAPTKGAEFSGPSLPSGWIETPWTSEGYSAIVNGVLLVDGARVATCDTNPTTGACLAETTQTTPSAIYSAPRTLEFSANFSGDSFQHAGFGVTFNPLDGTTEPWAIFSTSTGGSIFARTLAADGDFRNADLGLAPLGEFHRYRIDWKAASVDYYIDGILRVSHPVTIATPMRPVAASDFNPWGGIVFVDWMRLSPIATPGTFVSRVFDATGVVSWNSIQWKASTPAGTSLAISVRAGNGLDIDGSVIGAWTPIAGPGPFTNLASRYIQYRAEMASADPAVGPELEDIIISTGHAPVAMPDSAAVAKNGIYTFPPSGLGSLIDNDSDADGSDTLSVVSVTSPSHGTAVLNADGSVDYTPIANYFGADAFSYTVSDGLLTASAGVTIDVRDGNVPPVSNNDFFTVSEDTPLIVPAPGLLFNDTDVEHNPLTAILVSFPLHGMLTFGTNGAFTYTPALNYAGPDAFTYRANDGMDSGTIATVNILVNQVNDPPFTEPDSFNAMLNQPLDIPAPGVLANDHDVEVEDTAPMHTQLVSNVSNGTLTLNSDGSFSYVPNADFLGTDSFTYKAVDHFNAASLLPKTVTLTVAIKAVSQSVTSGTVSTGTGVSAGDPLNTAVTTPTPAIVTIAQGVISGSESPTGYTFMNHQVNITLTNPTTGVEVTATNEAPLVFNFEIDMSLIPAGQTAQTFEIFRNNVRIPNCLGQTTIPAANFDPCVSNRSNGTKVKLTVLTTHASNWNLGMVTAVGDDLFAINDAYFTNFETPLVVSAAGVLTNDLGPSSLTAVLSGSYGGTVDLASSGAFTFSPAAGFCGPANFTYELHKSPTQFDTATAVITVNCIPIAAGDPVTVLEDSGPSIIGVLFNDSDPENQTLTITEVTQGANGTVVQIGGTGLSYQPNPNFFGSDSFTYTVQDASGDPATGAVTVEVTPVNDAPGFTVGANQTANEDAGPVSVSPWATNLTLGPAETGQTLTFVATADNPALFSAQPVVAPDGSLTYTPAPNANGSSNVTVSVSDTGGTANGGANTSAPQVFAITITPVNDAPVATGQSVTTAEDTVSSAFTLAATDIDSASLTYSIVASPTNGTLNGTAPNLTYTPAPDFNGSDSFTFKAYDGSLDSNIATVSITVTPVNDPPAATSGTVTTVEDTPVSATLAGTDIDGNSLTYSIVGNGSKGSAAITNAATGAFTYTPALNANGTDTFTFMANDGTVDSSVATMTVTITPVNDAPVANDGTLTTNEDAAFSGTLSASDIDGNTLSYSIVANGGKGSAAITNAATGAYTYTPTANANGTDTFTFTVYDGTVYSNVATISVTITPVNDAPSASNGTLTTNEDAANTGTLSASDIDGSDTLSYSIVANGTKGSAAINPATGAYTYTPNLNAYGTDTFTFKAYDGTAYSNTATISVTISPVNDPPSFTKGADQTIYGLAGLQTIANWATSLSVGPGETGQTLMFTVTNSNSALFATQPAVAPNGTLTFAPSNLLGTAIVTVALQDNAGGSDTSPAQTFNLTVNKAATTTIVSSNSNPTLFGVPLVLKATINVAAPGVGVPAGTVTFKRGTTTIGSAGLVGNVATLTTSTLPVGTHSVTAVYAGNGNYLASTSPAMSQVIAPSATLTVTFSTHAIQDNTKNPKVVNVPVAGALVRVYTKKDVCTNGVVVTAKPKMWGTIFDGLDGPNNSADPGCPVVTVGTYRAEGTTAANGTLTIIVPPTANDPNEDYVVIGRTMGFDYLGTATDPDTLYAAGLVRNVPVNTIKKVLLHHIRTFSGKRTPGKATEEYGSYLAIVQPEFMDWTENQEQYPFVLVAEGDWDVTTSLAPPEGFIPDAPAMNAIVANATSAVQFTITDIASEWTETVVNHSIKHLGETRLRTETVAMFDKKATTAKNDARKVMHDSAETIVDVMTNDRVAHYNAPISITSHTPAMNGNAVLSPDGYFGYTPNPGFSGTDTFTYTITDAVGTSSTGTATITVLATPEVSVNAATAMEGNSGQSAVTLNVKLSNQSLETVTVNYQTVDSTAAAGADYVAASGSVTFAPLATTMPVMVQVIGDTLAEFHEKFIVRVSNPTNATIAANPDGLGTITDDDPPEISIAATPSITEGNTGVDNVAIVVTLSQSHEESVWVNYVTSPGTALAGSDYNHTTATLQFLPGATTKTIYIPVIYDTVGEANEYFYVDLNTPLNGTLTAASRATVTIVNDDNSTYVTSTSAEFGAGTVDGGAYLAETANGEVTLRPAAGVEFSGAALPADWTTTPLETGGTAGVANGRLAVDGAALEAPGTSVAGRTLEFNATFSNAPDQSIGFGGTTAPVGPMAMFVVNPNGQLYARSINGAKIVESPMSGVNWLNKPLAFKIVWAAGTVQYYIGTTLMITHSSMAWGTVAMRPVVIDGHTAGGTLSVDWMRLTPYAAAGAYTSAVFDAGAAVAWQKLTASASVVSGTTLTHTYRTGDTPEPDASWTAFTALGTNGVMTGSSRYIQFRTQGTSSNVTKTPILNDVTLAFRR